MSENAADPKPKPTKKLSGVLKLKTAVNKIKLNQDSNVDISQSRNGFRKLVSRDSTSDNFVKLVNNIKLLNTQNKALEKNEQI